MSSPRDDPDATHPHEELPEEPLSPLGRRVLTVVARHGYDVEAAVGRVDEAVPGIDGLLSPGLDHGELTAAVERVLEASDARTEDADWTDPDTSPDAVVLYVDGSSRGNPGPAGAGAVVLTEGTELARLGRPVGARTDNNTAEYAALHMGLDHLVRHLSPTAVEVRIDSMTVVDDVWRGEPGAAGDGYRDPIGERLARLPEHGWTHLVDDDPNPADALATVGADLAGLGPGA